MSDDTSNANGNAQEHDFEDRSSDFSGRIEMS